MTRAHRLASRSPTWARTAAAWNARKRAREAQRRRAQEASALDIAEAAQIIEIWNERLASGGPVLFSPTLRATALADYRWLTVHCPGCGTVKDIDLATIDRHPEASIMSLIPELSCRNCRPNAPFARLKRLSRS